MGVMPLEMLFIHILFLNYRFSNICFPCTCNYASFVSKRDGHLAIY